MKHSNELTDSALREILAAVPPTDVPVSDTAREVAWQRLQARLRDPARVPFVDEVKPPLELVRDDDLVALDEPGVAPTVRAASVLPVRGFSWRVVSAAAAVALMAGGAWWSTSSQQYDVPRGAAPREVRLADGSTVWVAPGGSVSVSRRLGWPASLAPATRTVELRGEAFFDVARDGRAFLVHTAALDVRVLGTRFSVRTGRDGRDGQVDVNEGRVAVSSGADTTVLGAGEGVALRAGTMQRRTIDPSRVAVWRQGGLAALDEPLGDVLDELQRRYGVEIEVASDVDIASVVSLFYPSAPAVDVVLSDLCTAQSLVFQRTNRGYRIARP